MAKSEKLEVKNNDLYDRFIKAAGTKLDPVTIIIRSHLLVEYYLDELIMIKIPRGDLFIDKINNFSTKLILVKSLDILSSDICDSIHKLNKLRNRCSHVYEYTVQESDIELIGRPFGLNYMKIKKEHSKTMKELLHWTMGLLTASLVGELSALTPKEKVEGIVGK